MKPSRVVVWFSCGAASATAASLAITKYGQARTRIVYCNTLASEHPDNRRFMRDVEQWLGITVKIISSEKYKSIDQVFMRTRYMAGVSGARCTTEMKKLPRYAYQRPTDIHVFGLTADELSRISTFEGNNPELTVDWVLRDANITKEDCYRIIEEADILLPAMYALGFKNNNCIGCVKATSATYWDKVRRYFPAIFRRRCAQSRELKVRLVQYHGERIFLDQLPAVIVDRRKREHEEEDIECGPVCVTPRIR